MSDLIQLEQGARPWLPTEDTAELLRLDEYNVPLAGLLRQGGHVFLYVCAAGEEDETNVWLYANLEQFEVEALDRVNGSDVVAAMAECLKDRRVMAALADRWRLEMWDWIDAGSEEPGVIVRRFLQRLRARVQRYEGSINQLQNDRSIDADADQPALLAL